MKEIYEQLGGQLVWGEEQLTNRVDNFITGAMQVPQFLNEGDVIRVDRREDKYMERAK